MYYVNPISAARARAASAANKLEAAINKSRTETRLKILKASVDASRIKLKIKA